MSRRARDLAAQRFRLTLALFDLGEHMMRETLRRRYPAASRAKIDALITEWLQRRPGAENGDCPGRLRPWPEL